MKKRAARFTVMLTLIPGGAPAQGTPAPGTDDALQGAAYVPGYRADKTLGTSPYTPRAGSLPGAMTPGYAAPMPPTEWTFRWSGFLSASVQLSSNQRPNAATGQSKTVFHVPPQTIDEYASFVGTSTMPGQWAQMTFSYGNEKVSANVQLSTWNPTDPTTYYQLGSQQFINNAYLSYNILPVGGVRLHAMAGYFYGVYGAIGQYGLGLYTNPIVGAVRGVGEDLVAEYDLSDKVTLAIEHSIMGTRNGKAPAGITPSGQNGSGNPLWPAAFMHHAHLGIEKKGESSARVRLHYLTSFAQDDRVQLPTDNPVTRAVDESYVKDGRVDTFGADASLGSPVWGFLGAAVSYTHGRDAYPIKGLITFGGDGESLTNRWWGVQNGGNGKLVAAGINYAASLGKILSFPAPFTPGRDLAINTGFVIAKTWTDFAPFDGRVRHKYGLDLMYTFLPFMAVGLRVDRVVPSSKESAETFHVLAPRLVFKGDWDSRYSVTVLYAKWFYGEKSHPENSSIVPGERLDDQLFALNAQMWW